MDVFLYSDIIPGMAEGLHADLTNLKEGEVINLHINSNGGSVTEGISMANLLGSTPNRINTHISGIAASMATVLALTGEHITMSDGSLFLIHDARFTSGGTAKQMKESASIAESLSSVIADIYVKKTGIAKAEIRALMEAETLLTAKEAKKMGFVDKVVKPMALAAKFDINQNIDMSLKDSIVNLGKSLTGNTENEEVIEELAEKANKDAENEVRAELEKADNPVDTLTAELVKNEDFLAFKNQVLEYMQTVSEFVEEQKSNDELKDDLKDVVRGELNEMLKGIKSKASVPVGGAFEKDETLNVSIPKVTDGDMQKRIQDRIDNKFNKTLTK